MKSSSHDPNRSFSHEGKIYGSLYGEWVQVIIKYLALKLQKLKNY